jgi:hypothetical protein
MDFRPKGKSKVYKEENVNKREKLDSRLKACTDNIKFCLLMILQ